MENSTSIAVGYNDPVRRATTRVQEVSREEIEDIRRRELAIFQTAPPEQALVLRKSSSQDYAGGEDDDYYANRRLVRRETIAEDTYGPPARAYSTRPRQSRDYSPSDSESSRERRRRRRRGHRRARSERSSQRQSQGQNQGQNQGQGQNQNQNQNGDFEDPGDFFEQHFDFSFGGAVTAAAGAALGAITARHFGRGKYLGQTEEENMRIAKKERWKTAGGAVVGAALLNMGEKKWKNYCEDKPERKEDVETAGELFGEAVCAF